MKAREIRIGDVLTPKPQWNASEHGHYHLPAKCIVLAVKVGVEYSQTGVLVCVRTKGKVDRWLDASWFTEVDE